ncbi:MAG: (2Fe-2S)-binding protein [Betaproteobacteria bacterium]|jgi:carbon-monoxide dehydrogenase small subunit|nr:(2Fe-2S)-binding protein [Rubrivivax sp.]
MPRLFLTVNGRPHPLDVPPEQTLVHLLRQDLGLTGTHVGCDTAQCGACTVLLDGQAVKSCNLLALQCEGRAVTSVEGLAAPDGSLNPLQQAFSRCHGLQCGYCTPGMLMSATALLAEEPHPTEAQIVHALEGNLCRCTGYVNIVAAVREAAAGPAPAPAAP